MTEDHRVASTTERARIARTGQPLKDGEVRLNGTIPCSISSFSFFFLYVIDGGSQINSMYVTIPIGLNLARMFGDKFLKEQDSRFSSEPYVSQAVRITRACTAFAVIAR